MGLHATAGYNLYYISPVLPFLCSTRLSANHTPQKMEYLGLLPHIHDVISTPCKLVRILLYACVVFAYSISITILCMYQHVVTYTLIFYYCAIARYELYVSYRKGTPCAAVLLTCRRHNNSHFVRTCKVHVHTPRR